MSSHQALLSRMLSCNMWFEASFKVGDTLPRIQKKNIPGLLQLSKSYGYIVIAVHPHLSGKLSHSMFSSSLIGVWRDRTAGVQHFAGCFSAHREDDLDLCIFEAGQDSEDDSGCKLSPEKCIWQKWCSKAKVGWNHQTKNSKILAKIGCFSAPRIEGNNKSPNVWNSARYRDTKNSPKTPWCVRTWQKMPKKGLSGIVHPQKRHVTALPATTWTMMHPWKLQIAFVILDSFILIHFNDWPSESKSNRMVPGEGHIILISFLSLK